MSKENNGGNGRKYPTWQWLATTIVIIMFGMAGYGYKQHDKVLDKLEEKKVDWVAFNLLLQQNKDMKDSIDKLIDLHITNNGENKGKKIK